MPTFCVTLTETVKYFVEVEAETEEAAEKIAVETWNDSAMPDKDFDALGEGVSVYITIPMSS